MRAMIPIAPYCPYALITEDLTNATEDRLGMIVTSGVVTLRKDGANLIGISIGGGAPLCPCLYVVQVFDGTPASKDGTLQSGDEIVAVNGLSVKGKTKLQVVNMIYEQKADVTLHYNKLHADPRQGKTLDIILKKVKHRLVENFSTSTTNALGLSRAILSNDLLVVKLKELKKTEIMYTGLVRQLRKMLRAFYQLILVHKAFGDIFADIGVHEPQVNASVAFLRFGEYHRQIEKNGKNMLKSVKPILSDLGTYLYKAIPDTKLTVRKYADTKFEYLAYCLKVKEMDDEEHDCYNSPIQETLYRVETGNYEYRLILRCREDARRRFTQLRSDVLVKMELLDNKHVQHLVWQLMKLAVGLRDFHSKTLALLENNTLFPIEMDLISTSYQRRPSDLIVEEESEEDDVGETDIASEATEDCELLTDLGSEEELREISLDIKTIATENNDILSKNNEYPDNKTLLKTSGNESDDEMLDLNGVNVRRLLNCIGHPGHGVLESKLNNLELEHGGDDDDDFLLQDSKEAPQDNTFKENQKGEYENNAVFQAED